MKERENSADCASFQPEAYCMPRELSWLDFNSRVLEEASLASNPLAERLKFIAIFNGNLDEFFMVRVAALQHAARTGDHRDPSGPRASELLRLIRRRVLRLVAGETRILYGDILPKLAARGIAIITREEAGAEMIGRLSDYFDRELLPLLTPLAVEHSRHFPLVGNGSVVLAVRLGFSEGKRARFAFVAIPDHVRRFVEAAPGKFLPAEELVAANLDKIFTGCRVIEALPFRVTRDMDFTVDDGQGGDFLLSIERNLRRRNARSPVRLELPAAAGGRLPGWLARQFKLPLDDCYRCRGILRRKALLELTAQLTGGELNNTPWPPLPSPSFPPGKSIFQALDEEGSVLNVLPFQSFDPVLRMLEEAADDPAVAVIKQTLYRVSGDSPVVRALLRAAEAGKQVTVIVELKARFDENNNINWARRLERSGAHVIYGISRLKVHAKALLAVRRTGGGFRRYVHLSTGNYNDRTACVYTDCGYFSSDQALGAEVAELFNVITGSSVPGRDWRQLTCAPFDLRSRLLRLIDREAEYSVPGAPGRITAKMNSLTDIEVISHLTAAAARGVRVELLVRGACCLKPGALSRNIKIVSVVDRYLEHSRIFRFANGGRPEYFLSSADWMPRNLDRRIEIMFSVGQPEAQKVLDLLLDAGMEDDEKGRVMKASGRYSRAAEPGASGHSGRRSQERIRKYFEDLNRKNTEFSGALEVHRAPDTPEEKP